MMGFFRSLFGVHDLSEKRSVVGTPVALGAGEAAYLKKSDQRLALLQDLLGRYLGTVHGPKIRAVLEKTQQIHNYLASRKRLHELELFHLRHTDHFLSTFTAIIAVHERHPARHKQNAPLIGTADVNQTKAQARAQLAALPDLIKPLQTSVQKYDADEAKKIVPRLYVAEISINTFENVTYYAPDSRGSLQPKLIGFSSSKKEKEAFEHFVSELLGLEKVAFVGNTLVTIPNNNGITPTGLVPVLHWEGFLYALNLNDMRLFPVRIYRKGP